MYAHSGAIVLPLWLRLGLSLLLLLPLLLLHLWTRQTGRGIGRYRHDRRALWWLLQEVAGKELGIMLSRKYSQEELLPGSLKGGDRLVWGALSSVWDCALRPVVQPEELAEARQKEGEAQAAGSVFGAGEGGKGEEEGGAHCWGMGLV